MLPLPHQPASPQQPTTGMPPSLDTRLRKRSTSEKHASPPAVSPGVTSHTTSFSSGRASKALLGLVSLAISSYFIYNNLYNSYRAPLQESFALCSHRGAQIYTVDPQIPRTQCLAVHDSKFIFTGSLGAHRANTSFLRLIFSLFPQTMYNHTGRIRLAATFRYATSNRARS